METFTIDAEFVRKLRSSIYGTAFMSLASLGLLFLAQSDDAFSRAIIYGACGLVFSLFGGATVFSLCELRRISKASVSVDGDGLWPAHKSKEDGLVRWSSIATLKERSHAKRLELLDVRGHLLMRLEFELSGFQRLHALVQQRMLHEPAGLHLPITFSKTPRRRLLEAALLSLMWATACFMVVQSQWIICGLAGLTGFVLLRQVLNEVSKLVVDADHLVVVYPLASRNLPQAEFESVELGSTSVFPLSVVLVLREGRKPIYLSHLDVTATELHQVLSRALDIRT